MATEPIRVGIIGGGQFMSRQHIQTVGRSQMLTLQHLSTREPDRLEELAGEYNPARRSTRWENVVEDPDVQVVIVGVLPQLHPRIAIAALECGKPVYVEKPLAPTPQECLSVQRLAWGKKIPLAVGFNRRFAPATELLLRAFRACGGPVSVYYRISDDDRIRPPEQAWKLGCRLLIEAVHIFDLLTFLIGAEPTGIYAREARYNDATVSIDFADGSQATLLSSSWGTMAQPKEHMEAILNRGAVEMDDFVEVRSYGVPGIPQVARFAGRPYDGCDNSHVEDFARRGREALLDLRLRYNRILQDAGVLEQSADPARWANVARIMGELPLPQINYASDKGWGTALEHFCQAAVEGRRPRNATAVDGNRATVCAVSARRSMESRQYVPLNPADWLAGRPGEGPEPGKQEKWKQLPK
jgi:predicted dehydrogenase